MNKNEMKKVVIIHTSNVIFEYLNKLFSELAPEINIKNILDDSLLMEVIEKGGVTKDVTQRLCNYAVIAEKIIGANIILVQCSSVGEAADIAAELVDIPLIKIDERMAEIACQTGSKIGVVATLRTTLGPTTRLIKKTADKLNLKVIITEKLCSGAFDLLKSGNIKEHNHMVIEAIRELAKEVEVIVCAQGSMVALLNELDEISVPVLTSPRSGVEFVLKVLGIK